MPTSTPFEGFDLHIYRSKIDGKVVVEIEGPDTEEDVTADDEPDIRIMLNEALIYNSGEVGDNLPQPPLPEGD